MYILKSVYAKQFQPHCFLTKFTFNFVRSICDEITFRSFKILIVYRYQWRSNIIRSFVIISTSPMCSVVISNWF